MSDRDRYRALMLEHLYGLLDPEEARDLTAYLASPEGAELRAEAERWRDRITTAAKVEFPDVKFTAPSEPTPARAESQPVRRGRLGMSAIWMRWGVAASFLLVFAGLGGPAAYQVIGWYVYSLSLIHI